MTSPADKVERECWQLTRWARLGDATLAALVWHQKGVKAEVWPCSLCGGYHLRTRGAEAK